VYFAVEGFVAAVLMDKSGRRKRRRHNDRDRAVERDDHSLSGVLIGGDSGDAEGIRGVRRRMGLIPRRRNANDTSDLASKRSTVLFRRLHHRRLHHRRLHHRRLHHRRLHHRRLRYRRLTNRSGTAGLLPFPENIARSLS
jgi:hypothetical protein